MTDEITRVAAAQLVESGISVSLARNLETRQTLLSTYYPLEHRMHGQLAPVHKLLLVAMGTQIFDNLDLEELTEIARGQRRWDFLFTAAPVRVPNGTGSPLNPITTF